MDERYTEMADLFAFAASLAVALPLVRVAFFEVRYLRSDLGVPRISDRTRNTIRRFPKGYRLDGANRR